MTIRKPDQVLDMLSPLQKPCCRRLIVLVLFTIVSCMGVEKSFGQGMLTRWSVSEFQPNIQQGGRANTIAVHPTKTNIIFVASETGGLFRTTDGGTHWQHVETLPCFRTNSIVFYPTDPQILIVTTGEDFKARGGGGIWRSTNSGASWTQASITAGVMGRLEAHEISIAPDTGAIYVATNFGSLMSTDQGAHWTYQDVFGAESQDRKIVFSILALGFDVVLAGGPAGIRRSTNGGLLWNETATDAVGGIADMHAFGRSPILWQHAYVVNGSTQLFHSEDSGKSWTQIVSAPSGGGGIAFIKVVVQENVVRPFHRYLQLYFGNRYSVARLVAPISALTGNPSYGGTWQPLVIDHPDPRDIAFDSAPNPLLLATDGGLHKTTDGGDNWKFVGGGRDGYNALQITEVKGQYIEDIRRHDLYFGTQDNSLWSSGNSGVTWVGMGGEGFFIEAEKRVATASVSKVTSSVVNQCNILSDPLYTNLACWTNPPGESADISAPMIVRRSFHVQAVKKSEGFSKGFAFTRNLGSSWRQFATFNEDRRDIPKLGRPGDASNSTIIYQAYHKGWYAAGNFEIDYLMRLSRSPGEATASVDYPAMNNFGGLGVSPTMFAFYSVFAVDPGDPFHLIAPDVINERMMETRDGGKNWTAVPALTDLVTDGGRLRFSWEFRSIVTSISFCPQNPRLVLAGTSEGGIYLSTDNGTNWERIPDSERVTLVTGFEWRSASDVIVSTYGRGLWRLRGRLAIPRFAFAAYCRAPCPIRSFAPSEQEPSFDRAILVFEGRVLGARIEAGILREVMITPGSSVVFVGEDDDRMNKIKITETNKAIPGMGPLPTPRKDWIIKGLVFEKSNRLQGVVFGDKEMVMTASTSEPDRVGNTKSPAAGKPYLQIVTKHYYGAPAAAPDEPFQITGTNFPRGAVLEIRIDDQTAVDKIQIDREGMFRAEVRAPIETGMHRVEIRSREGQRTVLDGSMFLVRPLDEFERKRAKSK